MPCVSIVRPLIMLLLSVALPRLAGAHHVVDFVVTSTEPAGGQLLVSYDFTTAVPLSFNFALGETSIYSGTNPGFDTADGDEFFPGTSIPYPIFPPGIPIHVVLVDNDGGRASMKINGVTLAQPGDSALVGTSGALPPGDLHRHPEWQLAVQGPPGTFSEARIAFKVSTTHPEYRDSPVYILTLTNGHLPPPEFAADGLDRASTRCQTTAGKAAHAYANQVLSALRRCLDAVQIHRAQQTAGLDPSRAFAVAERRCVGAVDLLARGEAKAAALLRKRCGPDGSADFDDAVIQQHLGLVRCRSEQLIAATYFRARTYLSRFALAGRPLHERFPCVHQTAGEEEGPS